MTITKKELITLLREDARYQRNVIKSGIETTIRINGFAVHHNRTVRFILCDEYVYLCYKQGGVTYSLAHITYDNIRTIGYKFRMEEKLAQRLKELRR